MYNFVLNFFDNLINSLLCFKFLDKGFSQNTGILFFKKYFTIL